MICLKCGDDKIFPDDFHYRKDKDYYYPYCKFCHREYTKNHYLNNKAYYAQKARRLDAKYRLAAYTWLYQYYKEHPCVDCGETDPIVLEFDHKDVNDKIKEVSVLVANGNLDAVKKEAAKCDVRCRNCHKRRTAIQFNYYWIDFLREYGGVVQMD